jgi:uncharacterized protein
MTAVHLVVVAKAPTPGRVKTRLCPPCDPRQAALVAAAALGDTLAAGDAAAMAARTLLLDGRYAVPDGWRAVRQRGTGLADRLANGFADCALPGHVTLLVGMDTPQLTPTLLDHAGSRIGPAHAVLGAAEDGGWWALGLYDAADAEALRGVPMSTASTGARTADALRSRGLGVAALPTLRDVDTAEDARAVAARCRSDGAFAAAVAAHVPSPEGVRR